MSAMKIPPYTTNGIENSGATAGNSGTSDKAASAGNSASSDRVQLSQNYTNLANVQKSILGTDSVRTDKVQQIQSQLDSGTYQVDAGEVAGRMLNEIL